jgi:hypothetical protein
MTWQCFELTYELLSPLHIGYHKVGNVQRTRYYIPARNMLAATAEGLVEGGQSQSYKDALDWVRENFAFSYFFLVGDSLPLLPHYRPNVGLRYDELSVHQFERRYVRALVTTAIAPKNRAAQEGSLHEVECIPENWADERGECCKTRLQGWFFTRDNVRWRAVFEALRVGGERRYGFGRLSLTSNKETVTLSGASLITGGSRPRIRLEATSPLLAHSPVQGLEAKGSIEALVGRETTTSDRYGRELTRGEVFWAPGSFCDSACEFEVGRDGIWTKAI